VPALFLVEGGSSKIVLIGYGALSERLLERLGSSQPDADEAVPSATRFVSNPPGSVVGHS
jgi:hypothetical protein